ncbi:MAG: DUF4358 domain-containing protein [Firmicutes bacterium]|nr:DUF4358 domain-containing protein [Bacillota bacterium]
MKWKLSFLELARIALAALTVFLLIFLMGSAPETNISLEELETVTAPRLLEGEAQKADERMLRRLYGLNPSDYAEIVLYYPASNMGVEELLLVKLNDTAQAEAVEAAIAARLAAQKQSFDGYGVEQTALLNNNAVTEVRGRYILFTVGVNAQAIRQAFMDAL